MTKFGEKGVQLEKKTLFQANFETGELSNSDAEICSTQPLKRIEKKLTFIGVFV